ncbi:uncharacterized protein G2W53_009585 [Senna tora]|uniref:CCHC-type domain-containing protein n=1 Tax=Senna tora TaxID=362788 RepID=A0A834WYC6_9FABA|nr:uncharacterized protein G2W53_009585 [Senna tora]
MAETDIGIHQEVKWSLSKLLCIFVYFDIYPSVLMSETNSYFKLPPLHHHSGSSSSNSSSTPPGPEYLFPRRGPVLNLDQSYVDYRRALWSKRAIAAFVDWREIPAFRLQAIINSQWKLQGSVTVKSKIRNFYILEFEDIQDWTFMIMNGPWAVQNSLLVIDKWQPAMTTDNLHINIVVVWLRFSGVPLELISNYVAFRLGELAGEVVELDPDNDYGKNMEFLRVKVLLNPAKPLLMGTFFTLSSGTKIWLSCMPKRTYRLCEQCGRIGHLDKDCNWGLIKTYSELHFQ